MQWKARSPMRLNACLLAAVPGPSEEQLPHEAHGFTVLSHETKQDRLMTVGSENYYYASQDFFREWAARWQAVYSNMGHAGHINEQTPLGEWPEGWLQWRPGVMRPRRVAQRSVAAGKIAKWLTSVDAA
jgi:predicted alpha/beta hydrolase family esterase